MLRVSILLQNGDEEEKPERLFHFLKRKILLVVWNRFWTVLE